jgi:hypothetical protein
MPNWLSWLVMILFVVGSLYLIVTSVGYGIDALDIAEGTLQWISLIGTWILTVVNVVMLLWLIYYVGTRLLADGQLSLISVAGLIFLLFLDWLLVEWFWDPDLLYGIGWQNDKSMLFMVANYGLAAAIYFGFNYYRRKQGIDVGKVYQEIPVE